MTSSVDAPSEQSNEPLAYLVVAGEGGAERSVPIFDQLFVGRECAGISESRRLVIDDPEVSSTHFEIRLDVVGDQAACAAPVLGHITVRRHTACTPNAPTNSSNAYAQHGWTPPTKTRCAKLSRVELLIVDDDE